VHNVSQWSNLRHLGESLGGAEGLLEAVSFKKATKGMGRGRVANARREWVPYSGGRNTKTMVQCMNGSLLGIISEVSLVGKQHYAVWVEVIMWKQCHLDAVCACAGLSAVLLQASWFKTDQPLILFWNYLKLLLFCLGVIMELTIVTVVFS